MSRVAESLSLVKFSHSVFALPFALMGAWLGAGGVPSGERLLWIVVCAVAARTAAMAFNRYLDREVDARNPRTANRELPAGKLSPAFALGLVVVSSVVFVAGAARLGPWPLRLALPVLFVLLGYSACKRFTSYAHAVLGLCLALAPLGAWLAVRGEFGTLQDLAPVLCLAGAVWSWVFGFDLIYACQDVDFDREAGLHSFPARFGVRAALLTARLLHVVTVALLLGVGLSAGLGALYFAAVVLSAALLVWEHGIVKPDDLSRVDMAFFTLNGWVGVGLFVGLVLDRALHS